MFKKILFAISLTTLIGCEPTEIPEVFSDEDIPSIAGYLTDNQEEFGVFYQAMIKGGISDALQSYNPHGNGFTLFLPSDDAFQRYIENNPDYENTEDLLADVAFLQELTRYHLVNTQIQTTEFPYGALPDTTATGDNLIIGFSTDLDSTVYRVNNVAPVINPNIEASNGYIHVISEVLKPVNFTGYEWLLGQEEFSILSEALTQTGIKDTLGLFRTTAEGQTVRNKYTILAEPDSVFERFGINSYSELLNKVGTPGLEPTDPLNGIYQFVGYHILEGEYFLVDFESVRNYNTYANAPVKIAPGIDIKINTGVDTFGISVSETGDTTYTDYVGLYYQESDILTKNGAIHVLDQFMEFFLPGRSVGTFEFLESPKILDLKKTPGTYIILDSEKEELEVLDWTGPELITYYITNSNSEQAWSKDYLQIEGNFSIEYTTPKILPGKYELFLRANGFNGNNLHASVNVFLDNKELGGIINLNSIGTSANPYLVDNKADGYRVGQVEFTEYRNHTIQIESFIPGIFIWDFIRFKPIN